MPWIAFERDYLWEPDAFTRHVAIAYKAGDVIFATREAAASAIERGAARKATPAETKRARRRTA